MPNLSHRSDFVRRVFAIAISVGFASAIAASKWVEEHRLPKDSEWSPLLCLLAGLILMVGSWEGYHRHFSKTDEKITIFFTDVTLLFTYLLILLLSPAPILFLWLVAIVFALYAAWDLQVLLYYREKDSWKRFLITVLWTLGFAFLTHFWHEKPGNPNWVAYSVGAAGIMFRVRALRTVPWTVCAIIITCGAYPILTTYGQ